MRVCVCVCVCEGGGDGEREDRRSPSRITFEAKDGKEDSGERFSGLFCCIGHGYRSRAPQSSEAGSSAISFAGR